MFTVLLAEKEHIDAIRQENKLFFEPFLDSKELAFCYWNPAGQNLYDSAPGLLDAVGRRKEWRAVIINNCSESALKRQNPFDIVDYRGVSALPVPKMTPDEGEDWDEWENTWKTYYEDLTREKEAVYNNALEIPLQKLSTWLCFRPEDYILNEVQEKQDVHDWAMEKINNDSIKPSDRMELLERNQYKRELRLKEQIRRTFVAEQYLNIAYPTEIFCISVRTAENSFFNPDDYWNVRRDSDYSAFADRNMYFDKMRFLIFDLLPQMHRNYRNDYIRFLATVLIFASNPAPGSAMQARRLYRMEVETDDTPLCTLVTSYDRKLAATAEAIEIEMDRIRSEIPGELTDKAAEALFCTPKDVTVVLDDACDPEKVYAEKDYGLFFDTPYDEARKWNSNYQVSEKPLTYIVKQQARSVRKSVGQMHLSSEVSDVNISRLTPFQIDDIRDYTDTAEDEMVASIPSDLSDPSRYTQRLADAAEKVDQVIRRRMTRKTALTLGAISLGLYLVCFLPFLFSNVNTPRSVTTAITLCVSVLVIMTIILLVTLLVMRSTLLKAVQGYNSIADGIMEEIRNAMKQFSQYLSASCNVRRGHSVLNYARNNVDEYTMGLRIRKKHLEDIRKRRAYLAEDYGDYFGDRSFWDETMIHPYIYDFDRKTEYDYPAPFLAGDNRQIEFVSTGNLVSVPISFVTKILVRMEGIYDE